MDINRDDLPKTITSLWYIGREDENARDYKDLSHNERCRLSASLIEGTDQYKFSLIEASYHEAATLEDAKCNLKDGGVGRLLREHFSFSSILFDDISTLANSLKLEARGYTVRDTAFEETFSIKDVEQAMFAFRDGKQPAYTGPLSWCNHVEDGAENSMLVFSIYGRFSSVFGQPSEKIKAGHFNWPQIAQHLSNPMVTNSDPAASAQKPSDIERALFRLG